MKRARAPNFTTAEILHLLKLVENYHPIIENKRTDGATTKDKHAAWQNLAVEYNSQTSFSPRTAYNLLSCYKNLKNKVKKMHSYGKKSIKVELHGQDWNRVAQATEESSSDCQHIFQKLVKEAKKEEALYRKEINRTGGGPPPQPSCSRDPVVEKVKSLIGPSLEDLHTVYDGDAEYIKEQQMQLSNDMQAQPIEFVSSPSPQPDQEFNKSDDNKTLNIIKEKVDPCLELSKKGKSKKKLNVSHSFQKLAHNKQELVNVQKTLADYQICHQKLLIELAKEKLQFEKKKNEMELEYLKEKHELELDLLRNKKY